MALLTIAEATKHYNNQLVDGVAATIVQQNPILGVMPWQAISGDTIKFNWENTMGGADFIAVNAALDADDHLAASAVTAKYASLTTAVGQANVDRLVLKTSQAAGVDPMVYELASKAKNLSLKYADNLAKGPTANGINSFAAQAGVSLDGAGRDVDFDVLDDLCNLVQGSVDFIVGSRKAATAYKQKLRAQGGATEMVVINDPFTGEARQVLSFEGIPFFIMDALTTDEDADGGLKNDATPAVGALQSLYAGRFDDGSRKTGISMIHAAGTPAGLEIEDLGALEGYVANGKRIVQHLNFVNFAKHGLVRVYNLI